MGTRANIIIKEKQSGSFKTIYHSQDGRTDGLGLFLKEYVKTPEAISKIYTFALNECLTNDSCFHFSKYEIEGDKPISPILLNGSKYERLCQFFEYGYGDLNKLIQSDLEFIYFILTDNETNEVEIKYIDLCKQKLQGGYDKTKGANHHYTEMSMDELLDEAYDLV